MTMLDVRVGDDFVGVLLETYRDPEASRPRVRPVEQLPQHLRTEFPRNLRASVPLGTRFRANVKICQKHLPNGQPKGRPYLRASENSIEIVSNYKPEQNIQAIKQSNSRSGLAYYYVKYEQKAENPQDTFANLREQAYAASTESIAHRPQVLDQAKRSQLIVRYALSRSQGFCEGCKKPAPFIRRNGKPYLEIHHIVAVAGGGMDAPANVAAICPNCHAHVSHGRDGANYNNEIAEYIADKERSLSSSQ